MKQLILVTVLGLLVISCKKTNSDINEVVVIGGGLMGSSTAWQLSKKGKSVLLLEKQDSIYTQGSSYGEARIARSNNRGNDMWSYLHNRSVKETEELIDFLNNDTPNAYKMEDIYTTSPVTYVGRTHIYDKLMASLKRQKVDYKIASTPKEGQEIFNVLLPDSVLIQREYNKYSGTVNPKVLIQLLHKAIVKKNNEVKYGQTVTSIQKLPNYYEISVTDNKTKEQYNIKSKKIVSAAGPYTGKLLGKIAPAFDSLIKPERVFLSFLKIKDETYTSLSQAQKEVIKNSYPVINSSTGTRGGSFFSMIENYVDDKPIIKIGGHFQRSKINNLDDVWNEKLTPDEIEWSKTSTLRYFTLLQLPLEIKDLELIDGYSCVYSLTESEVPYVTTLYKDNFEPDMNFIVLAGMSGVGGKGAMTYGLIGANLITNESESDPQYTEVKNALGFNRLLSDIND
ncbi:FAD-dependent oxidoreductase [Dokdonia sp.]|uniref:NAD(P)/FAD-dependent oxidoreductase n=1 Tax=Dokdonia sp. TaxID=2024995 RepID=UPI0032655372